MRCSPRDVRAAAIVALAWLVAPVSLSGAQPPPAQAAAAPAASPEEREFRDLLQRYYDACARKDIEAVEQLWHPNGPVRLRRNLLVVEFERSDIALTNLTLSGVAADPGGGKARVVADLKATDAKTKRTRNERRVRDVTFLQDGGVWKIWNEASVGGELARRLLAAPEAERDRMLATEPELASDDALVGLSIEVARLRGQGMSSGMLDVLALQGRLARAVGNDAALARSLLDTGLLHQVAGRMDAAAAAFSAARDAYASVGDENQVAACEANLGSVAYITRNYAVAAEHYQKAFEKYEALHDEPRIASLRHSLGNIYYVQGEFDRALESYGQGLAVVERTGDKFSTAALLQAIGMVHKELGNYAPAAEAWRRSFDLSLAAGDITRAAKALQSVGEVQRLQGDFGRALESYSASLQLWEKTPDRANRATTMFGIGQVLALQRSFTRAVEWYQKAADLDRTSGLEGGVARDLGGLGGAHVALNQPEVALDEYQRSLALREKLEDRIGVMWTLVHIGVLHASQSRHDRAIETYQRALDLAEREGDLAATCTTLALRASSCLAQKDHEGALAAAGRAAEMAAGIDHPDVVAHARVTAGKVHQQAGRLNEARAAFEESLAALARVAVGPGADTFFDDRRRPYLAMVDLLVSQNKGAEAFLWAERARQQALADLLGGDGAIISKGLAADERDEERRLRRESRNLVVRIRRERARPRPDATRLSALQGDLARIEAERDIARRRLYEAHPALKLQRAQAEPFGVAAAGELLGDANSAVLAFVVSEARTWAFVITKDPTSGQGTLQQVATIEVTADELLKQVERFHSAIVRKEDTASAASRALRTLLIGPVEATLAKKTRLLVLPDAFLWALPFEALQTEASRYLVEDAAVTYAQSLTALGAMAGAFRTRTPRRSVVAWASPVLQKPADDRIALMRPAASLKPSDDAEREARAVAALFGPGASKVLLRDQAKLDQLSTGIPAGSIVHLAVPTFVSNASPLYSLIALTPADKADAAGGLVEIADAIGWDLPADAAVLSRIDASAGAASDEGLTGLSWCLFVAGTPTIVTNRWSLGEPDGVALVTGLYKAWLAPPAGRSGGRSMAEAAQRAVGRLIAQPATNHPYHWAGLMVIGR